jgi:small redox-active disulfide protein 2
MEIKVLGTGCANCKTTLKLIKDVAAEKGVTVDLHKMEDIQSIMGYGVIATPGVVIDSQVVHAGGVPSRDKIAGWLAGAVNAPMSAKSSDCVAGECA